MHSSVIVNTSPIFYLHRIGLLEILEKLYGTIIVPPGVIDELRGLGRVDPPYHLVSKKVFCMSKLKE